MGVGGGTFDDAAPVVFILGRVFAVFVTLSWFVSICFDSFVSSARFQASEKAELMGVTV